MLSDLYKFLTVGDFSSLDSDRAANLQLVRDAITTPEPVVAPDTKFRMYQPPLAEGAKLPALTYQLISDEAELTQDGDSGLYVARVQMDVWSTKASEREALGIALKLGLLGFAGQMGGGSPATFTGVYAITFDNAIDEDMPDRLQYRRMLDFHVMHA